jgi:curli biogenesis system outer membrane secretion channel CsgG
MYLRLMGVSTSEVGYTAATTGRGDHEVHKGHVVALGEKIFKILLKF